jgi:hypothetical protein
MALLDHEEAAVSLMTIVLYMYIRYSQPKV